MPALVTEVGILRAELAAAAQAEIDAWQPTEEEGDPEIGFGGICDRVAGAMAQVLANAGHAVVDGGQDGDDHAWLIVIDATRAQAVGVDIPPGVYETGGGYSWRKRPGVTVTLTDVVIWPIAYTDVADLIME